MATQSNPEAASLTSAVQQPALFTEWLRFWRKRRGMSQLELSGYSGISQRHISFMESGRSQPSREMVVKLGIVLQLPLRQRNVMLLAAGFAPLYQERPLDDPELKPARDVLDMMLRQHEPYPATIVDRLWNIVSANAPASAMLQWMLGPPEHIAPEVIASRNILFLTLHPKGLRPYIRDFESIAAELLQGLQREALAEGPGGGQAAQLLQQLSGLPDLPINQSPDPTLSQSPVQTMSIHKDGIELNLVTTVATLGVTREVTLDELRAELIFPADEPSAAHLRMFAGRATPEQ